MIEDPELDVAKALFIFVYYVGFRVIFKIRVQENFDKRDKKKHR
jgi:hypothetical protein